MLNWLSPMRLDVAFRVLVPVVLAALVVQRGFYSRKYGVHGQGVLGVTRRYRPPIARAVGAGVALLATILYFAAPHASPGPH